MSGRKRPPRGGKADAPNRGDREETDYAQFEGLWRKRFVASSGKRGGAPQTKKKRRAEEMGKNGGGGSKNECSIKDGGTKGRNGAEEAPATTNSNRKRRRAIDHLHSQHDHHPSQQPLYRHLSIPQIDNLVGWATSHRGNEDTFKRNGGGKDEDERRLGLAHLPKAPPPPSHVAFLRGRIGERLKDGPSKGKKSKSGKGEDNTGRGLEAMSTSAYVAVGMAAEEALTMALMPLAEAHVARCRRLERQTRKGANERRTNGTLNPPSNDEDPSSDNRQERRRRADDPFHAWTLPPGEAVAELAREGSTEGRNALAALLERHPDVAQRRASSDTDSDGD